MVYILREERIPAEVTKKFVDSPKTLQLNGVLVTERAPYLLISTLHVPPVKFLGADKNRVTNHEQVPSKIPPGDSNPHCCISTTYPGSRLNRT